jgi:hypothetical protein
MPILQSCDHGLETKSENLEPISSRDQWRKSIQAQIRKAWFKGKNIPYSLCYSDLYVGSYRAVYHRIHLYGEMNSL